LQSFPYWPTHSCRAGTTRSALTVEFTLVLVTQVGVSSPDGVMAAGREILGRCIEAGGTITGEHGVGLEKQSFMPLIFTPADLDVMGRVRAAIDPSGNFNPDKVLPTPEAAHGVPQRTGMPALVAEGLWV